MSDSLTRLQNQLNALTFELIETNRTLLQRLEKAGGSAAECRQVQQRIERLRSLIPNRH